MECSTVPSVNILLLRALGKSEVKVKLSPETCSPIEELGMGTTWAFTATLYCNIGPAIDEPGRWRLPLLSMVP